MEFKSFAFTFRPMDGVTDQHVEQMDRWSRKNCEYYHIITEKTGSARHIHAALFLKKSQTRSNLSVRLSRLYSEISPSEKQVMLKGLKVLYNYDWIGSYLSKDDDTVVISSNLPEKSFLESWFPPKPPTLTAVKQRKCSLYYHELEELWYKHQEVTVEITTVTCRDFLFKLMYSLRIIPVIKDDKTIIQTARHLTRWLTKKEHSTIELPPFEKEED